MNASLKKHLNDYRLIVVLAAIRKWELFKKLKSGIQCSKPPRTTEERILLAAQSLGVVEDRGAGILYWNRGYDSCDQEEDLEEFFAYLAHQDTYLKIISGHDLGSPWDNPSTQIAKKPKEYLDFLSGVARSHARHAMWLANLDLLDSSLKLVDLGGGLGAFSEAWVRSRVERSATVIDLPEVLPLFANYVKGERERVSFQGADLTNLATALPSGDVYLFANFLHLFHDWVDVFVGVCKKIPKNSHVVVLEADPQSRAGAIFDLQVHLRSGGEGGLIYPKALELAFVEAGLENLIIEEYSHEDDVLGRRYMAWIALK